MNYKESNASDIIELHVEDSGENIRDLEIEIGKLEEELKFEEARIRGMEAKIQGRFCIEIKRIQELSALYKKQKKAKKEKRLEQKKRGKNYREPIGLKKISTASSEKSVPENDDLAEMKRLYREAVLMVHPDKFINAPEEKCRLSKELTIQLIDIYQNGNIDELRNIHGHIISGNAMAYDPGRNEGSIPDPQALYNHLKKKRESVISDLNSARMSRIYQILSTYDDPMKFLDELALQFAIRISQLERRTRS